MVLAEHLNEKGIFAYVEGIGDVLAVPGNDYTIWIDTITAGGTQYPSSISENDYNTWIDGWRINSGLNTTINPNLKPLAINYLLSTNSCP